MSGQGMNREIGKYYFEGLSSRSNKRLISKNFPSFKSAVEEAIERKRKGKIVQAQIFHTKNFISDVDIADLDLSGRVRRYNRDKKEFELFNIKGNKWGKWQ